MSHITVRRIVYETCEAIWKKLQPDHLPLPTKESLLKVSAEFFDKWNFPNCAGCIDGKHIRIKCPKKSGTMFYNYKQYFSIVLQAVADANYKFLCVDVGGYGKQSDGGTFISSTLRQQLETGFFLPDSKKLPNTDVVLPHVLLGDDAYPLKTYLMKPYSKRHLSREEEIFNYRLSRCRRTVECAFGIMAAKWRLLNKPIETNPEKGDLIVKCLSLLHNIIIDREGVFQSNVLQAELIQEHNKTGGDKSRVNNRSTNMACDVRDTFKVYFNSELGAIPQQNNI